MQFKNIVGHKEVKARLINTVAENRISHAQLFLGEEGSGNLAMAIAYAQYISCQNKTEQDSCGTCPSCVKFDKLIHPDLHFIFPVATNAVIKKNPISANFLVQWREALLESPYLSIERWQQKMETGNKQLLIPKDESTEILKVLHLKTYESEYKTVIIWYPEKFNITSANKLLKILEEPPQKTLFLLVAHFSEQIISTILSRTQLVKIGRINPQDIEKELIANYSIDQEQAENIAQAADGNFINALRLTETGETQILFFNLFKEWMRAAFKGDVPALIDWSEEIAKTSFGREKQKQFLQYALHIFRESLIKNYGDEKLKRTTTEENKFMLKFAPFIHGANCIDIIELFNTSYYHIERNVNPKVLFLDVSLKLTKLLRVSAPK